MITANRLALARALLFATALAVAFSTSSGCGGSENPARFAGTIDVPDRAPVRVDAKSFVKGQPPRKAANQ